MSLQPGTFFYGISDDRDDLMYAGDRVICLMIHPLDDGNHRFLILQSVYSKGLFYDSPKPLDEQLHYGSKPSIKMERYHDSISEYHEAVADYIRFPTQEKADSISSRFDDFTFDRRMMLSSCKEFEPTQSSFDDAMKHQILACDDYDDYVEEYLPFNFSENAIEMALQFFDFHSFQKAFFPHKKLSSLLCNTNPL